MNQPTYEPILPENWENKYVASNPQASPNVMNEWPAKLQSDYFWGPLIQSFSIQ